jgi:hypothetical protein
MYIAAQHKNQIGIVLQGCGFNGFVRFGLMALILRAIHNKSILLTKLGNTVVVRIGVPA